MEEGLLRIGANLDLFKKCGEGTNVKLVTRYITSHKETI